MTSRPTPPPRRPTPPARTESTDAREDKPYAFVSFPKDPPKLAKPIGHDRYFKDCYQGTLKLRLVVGKPVHVFTGAVMLGQDVGMRVPLIKTMTQGKNRELIIQGSSLKGCIRSIYEAITNSTMAVITPKFRDKYPPNRLPCRDKERLCPASRVFGALDWQGLVEFSDAVCSESKGVQGFMPSLYAPRSECPVYRTGGRKFYYHFSNTVNPGDSRGIPVLQAAEQNAFQTNLHFKNLKAAELGTLLIALGQDEKSPFALKLGGGKPIGMGSMKVEITAAEIVRDQDLQSRYSSYVPPENQTYEGDRLKQFMQTCTREAQTGKPSLVLSEQLHQVAGILKYPSDRTPPSGMY